MTEDPQKTPVALRVQASPVASELRLIDGVVPEVLADTALCRECADRWGQVEGFISDTDPSGRETTFLKVSGQPHLLAFRWEMLECIDSQLELYLDGGRDLLPVETNRGRYAVWHALAGANVIDRTRGWENGKLITPHFIPHRLHGTGGLFTNVGCTATHILMLVLPDDLPSMLGGPESNDRPPPGFKMMDCRSLLQEYVWHAWTGLKFDIIWRADSDDEVVRT